MALAVRQHFQPSHKSAEHTVAHGGDEPNDTTGGGIKGDHSAIAVAQDGGKLVAARERRPADEEPAELVWREVVDCGRVGDHIWIVEHTSGIRGPR